MNRQQIKTRKAIFMAFTELLSKKNYNKITVQEIIDLADIGRSTFYSHFETKDDLLKEICRELFEHIFSNDLSRECSKIFENSNKNPKILITHILYHLKENKEEFIKVLSCESNDLFLSYFKKYLDKLIDEYIFIEKTEDEKFKRFLKNHICCTFVETIKWWIKNQMEESPEEIADYFFKVVDPII